MEEKKHENGNGLPTKGGKRVPEGKKARMKASLVKQRTRKEIRSGLSFPVTRIRNALRKSRCCKSIGLGAAIYTTAVLEYLTAELTELSGNCSKENKRKRIIPRDILLAIRNDEELNLFLKNVTIPEAGVIPHILPTLLTKAQQEKYWEMSSNNPAPKTTKGKKKEKKASSEPALSDISTFLN